MLNHRLTTSRLILRSPQIEDAAIFKSFYEKNRSHLSPWETVEDLTESSSPHAYEDKIKSWIKEEEQGSAVRFFIFDKSDTNSPLIGFCSFSQICFGYFQACYLGYKIDYEQQGKGLMFEALKEAIRFIFKEIRLHRIMANYMPANAKSKKLLERLGFQVEGFAKNYLLINQRWEDHCLTALSFEQWALHST